METEKYCMQHCRRLACLFAVLLSACTPASNDGATNTPTTVKDATAFAEQVVLSNLEYLEQDAYATADRAWGERLAMQCRACHALEKGGPTLLGPALHGVFGRHAGTAPGFDYSPALASVGFVWTPAALDAWLAAPSQFLPGNRMAFAGIQRESDRNALIAYLLQSTGAGDDAGTGVADQ